MDSHPSKSALDHKGQQFEHKWTESRCGPVCSICGFGFEAVHDKPCSELVSRFELNQPIPPPLPCKPPLKQVHFKGLRWDIFDNRGRGYSKLMKEITRHTFYVARQFIKLITLGLIITLAIWMSNIFVTIIVVVVGLLICLFISMDWDDTINGIENIHLEFVLHERCEKCGAYDYANHKWNTFQSSYSRTEERSIQINNRGGDNIGSLNWETQIEEPCETGSHWYECKRCGHKWSVRV